ncbi:LPXTG cell wall anchor domain-containing protein, partial [Patescibacteria group bacterium]|nr:LPXTG cell wall anchor domain-containing protein [Patescibacteria group bacterium]
VTNVEEDEIVEFRIKIKNEGEIEVDDMKMTDKLPKEMERVGGDGLTEYWDDFEPGETETFIIKAKVKDSEYDKKNFDKCVVNKAEVSYDDDHEGSDTATVCYHEGELKELPKTGSNSLVYGVFGLALTGVGAISKKFKK